MIVLEKEIIYCITNSKEQLKNIAKILQIGMVEKKQLKYSNSKINTITLKVNKTKISKTR